MNVRIHRAATVRLATLATVIALAGAASAQNPSDWTEPFPPFRIAGNLYYVGSKGLANYLITTPRGHILINSDLEANVPLIRDSVEKLGFTFTDIKILLISQAHWDHNAGSDRITKLTGARYVVMDADVPNVESGGKTDFHYGKDPETLYPPTKVDRVLHDGDQVKVGGTVLVAHLTPGHTKGCTTWSTTVTEGGTTRNVVIVGGTSVNDGYKLVNNTAYPGIASDYERTFKVLKSLPVDYFLGAHGTYFRMDEKYARLQAGAKAPFIDPEGYRQFVSDAEQAFRTELAKQQGRVATQTRPRGRDLGIPFPGQTGPLNAITDVAGIAVGHVTLIEGDGKLVPAPRATRRRLALDRPLAGVNNRREMGRPICAVTGPRGRV